MPNSSDDSDSIKCVEDFIDYYDQPKLSSKQKEPAKSKAAFKAAKVKAQKKPARLAKPKVISTQVTSKSPCTPSQPSQKKCGKGKKKPRNKKKVQNQCPMETILIPEDKFKRALDLINSESNYFDKTPTNYENVPDFKERPPVSYYCKTSIKFNGESDKPVHTFAPTSMIRIMVELHNCIKNDDWENFAKLIELGSVKLFNRQTYGTLFKKMALIAMLYDPLVCQTDLLQTFMEGVIGYAEKDEFLQLVTRMPTNINDIKNVLLGLLNDNFDIVYRQTEDAEDDDRVSGESLDKLLDAVEDIIDVDELEYDESFFFGDN